MELKIQQDYERVATEFAEKAIDTAGDDIETILLYGSVGRGGADEHSDIDLLIITKHPDRIREHLSFIRSKLDVEYGTLTTLTFRTPTNLRKGLENGSLFIKEVINEGKVLYDSGTLQKICRKLS